MWAVAIDTAQNGPPALAAIARHYLDTHSHPTAGSGLTEREEQVMRHITHGYSNKEIAAKMGLSVKTVETYRARAVEKLGLKTRVALMQFATRQGWMNPDAPDWA